MSHKRRTSWRIPLQKRGDTRVHQHHCRVTGVEGEGIMRARVVNSSYNNATLGYGNATTASKYFEEQWVLVYSSNQQHARSMITNHPLQSQVIHSPHAKSLSLSRCMQIMRRTLLLVNPRLAIIEILEVVCQLLALNHDYLEFNYPLNFDKIWL